MNTAVLSLQTLPNLKGPGTASPTQSLCCSFRMAAGLPLFAIDCITDDFTITVTDVPGFDPVLQESGRIDAAAAGDDAPLVREVPDNHGNITPGWTRNNHAVTTFNRHTG